MNFRHPGLDPGPAFILRVTPGMTVAPSLQRQRRKAEILRKIAPGRILLMDEIILPIARPALDPLLANDRLLHRVVPFEPHEALDAVLPGEASDEALAMLMNATQEVRSHACVQRAVGCSGEQINAGLSFHIPTRQQGGSRLKAGMTWTDETRLQ